MKKYLLIFLGIFSLFFIFDNVYAASELYDYLFVTASVPHEDGSYTPLGSRNPGVTSTTTNWSTIGFGYYNINGTFKPGEKWRIVANYCVQNTDFNNFSKQSSVDMNVIKYSYRYGNTCTYTSSSGYVYVGTDVYFTVDFTISDTDYLTGTSRFLFSRPSTNNSFIAFKDYTIFPSSEITDNDNTNSIIDNSDKNQQETNDRLDNINGSLNDDSAPDTSNAFKDIKLNTNSAISNLVLMPINYLNRVLNLSKNTCSAYSLDFGIFNSDYKLNLPCIKLENFFGSQWWNVIDYLICFYMIYNIIMLAISAFEDITSLRDSYDSLYQPKHSEDYYRPKHGGD